MNGDRVFNQEEKAKLTTLINEGLTVMSEVDALNEGLTDTVKAIAEEMQIKPTVLKKALRTAYKADFEKALSINPEALKGSAYTSLGTLYAKVPGWPLGFGDDDKAKEMLQKAVAINPTGIDANYFYASYLADEGETAEAEKYLLKAQQAPARPERPVADKGRQKEIAELLAKLKKEQEEQED